MMHLEEIKETFTDHSRRDNIELGFIFRNKTLPKESDAIELYTVTKISQSAEVIHKSLVALEKSTSYYPDQEHFGLVSININDTPKPNPNRTLKKIIKCYDNRRLKNRVSVLNETLKEYRQVEHIQKITSLQNIFFEYKKFQEATDLIRWNLSDDDNDILVDEAYKILYKVETNIHKGASNSLICSVIYESFFSLFENQVNHVNIINFLLQQINIYKYNNTILFGFLSASNYKRKDLNYYNDFLSKLKNKISTETNSSEDELKKIFYGLD